MIEDGLVVFCKVTVVDHTRRSGSVMLWCREVTLEIRASWATSLFVFTVTPTCIRSDNAVICLDFIVPKAYAVRRPSWKTTDLVSWNVRIIYNH